ncbi:hypothetical protein A2631_05730 [Candidatus Daviesbacteria bacterium RIFCSPHIGHO2_01_FULL_44_29]|uniref:Probable inosine/xanthosine triphosphatase n=1 Tax=Candidatus Daviesbacteria bacterium RIFCSPHIGHO2_02_FULL_43_12 TaxID=1797776 RepID=A0A1F5KI61_9BACT|nr:MAG: hypothetical protein A2631_05730 [Candidatus Daviesbacteria bacterium RIFCSPHIGHO2_01_FULL_44_29]OGE39487.1 MAG: hypothetical protein A3E86_04030 [Candidatus Daviesbacteria bacterium RIFCSPHIGHO2_12_FULL_47_45]OGE40647.1 MAG: hypothetical protein A3D25_05820 [Candidatus Daviesbacteria bacterium RIFCSPHIGHO2_02_FULL_43_12]OGE69857.1 MAG: hypothetical protein A3B55_05605 [Candidatus Daviesbacteria bacterium RIFCSPLOWO2_01_FULL_43_15]
MKVAVGSKNPVKVEAVTIAFAKVWPAENLEIEGVEVSSGVSAQPMSDKESIKGAINRARRALKLLGADFGVGLEGGIQKIGNKWFDCGWLVVIDKQGRTGIGSTVRMSVPPVMVQLIKKGKELGEACDITFNRVNTKHAEGHFGLMTKNHITRTSGYVDGVISALGHFMIPDVFDRK